MDYIHSSVMPQEVLQYLGLAERGGIVVDATLGEGGHSELFLQSNPHIRIIGLDADPVILERARTRLAPFDSRVTLHHVWFDEFFARYEQAERPDRILFDLGISMFHYRLSGRGFTFQGEEPLDMRLGGGADVTARDILASYSETELADLIYQFGEERYSRRIARRIVEMRKERPLTTVGELAEVVSRAVPPAYRHGRIHPATRTFQALRIAVNDELGRLRRALAGAYRVLAPGGRMGVISFHSLEDRIVKYFFREKKNLSISQAEAPITRVGEESAGARILTKKPLVPTEEEARANPASRSAKFRVCEKIEPEDGPV